MLRIPLIQLILQTQLILLALPALLVLLILLIRRALLVLLSLYVRIWQPEINYKEVRGEGEKFNF
jgi:hypothetical protein